ncbi:cell division protein ZapA [Altererythrobacter sp. SALINAS58]|uniref:cell division protein ZapA n=1 Tax=Alteripontixanthobacter muriae TaxID=2705546 RepID=UPI0015766279|nr:cell division protein ZapA [Alteripontixanthobacter muriae]NTZ41541.1 cell division protein ZapA [Alteripontixanthobacter muriae]
MSTAGSQVTLSIGGRLYTVTCAAGEEAHVKQLAAIIDQKMAQLGANKAPQASQNLLFCALLLADELHEQSAGLADAASSLASIEEERNSFSAYRNKVEAEKESLLGELSELRNIAKANSEERTKLAAEVERLNQQIADQADAPARILSTSPEDPALAPALERFAEMLEKCADGLEDRLGSADAIH